MHALKNLKLHLGYNNITDISCLDDALKELKSIKILEVDLQYTILII